MKTIVITGSTRGIGYGLADAFLGLGCAVTICGRRPPDVERVTAELSAKFAPERVLGVPCDVTQFDQVQNLWNVSKSHFGKVDIWINNAGIGQPRRNFWENAPDDLEIVVGTNLLGTMYGAKVALAGMLEQGFGSLYNMEGLGSDGRRVPGLTLYGTTKYGLRYFTDALVEEAKGTPVKVNALSPGMVITDLLTQQYEDRPEEWEEAKQIFNILADRVETVVPWLAQQILTNDKSGARISWLTRRKVVGRFLAARFRKRDLFA